MKEDIIALIGGPVREDFKTEYKTVTLKCNLDFEIQLSSPNTKYIIKCNFDLNNKTIEVPENSILFFDGGSLSNGTLNCNDTILYSITDKENVLYNVELENRYRWYLELVLDKDYELEKYSGLGRVYLKRNIIDGWPNNTWLYIVKNNIPYLLYSYGLEFYAVYNEDSDEGLILENNLVEKYDNYNINDIINDVQYRYLSFTENNGIYTITKPDGSTITDILLNNTNIYKVNSTTNKRGVNILTQEMINKPNIVYYIQYDFDLNNATINIPENSILKFEGGSLSNGELFGNNSSVEAPQETIFKNVVISGIWNTKEIYDIWFDYVLEEGVAKNQIIHNVLNLTNDNCQSTINFIRNTEYLIELPKIDLCDIDPTWKNNPNSDNGTRLNIVWWMYCHTPNKYNWGKMNPIKDHVVIFKISSNTNINLNSDIRMLPTPQSYYCIFQQRSKKNINIFGNGKIFGDNYGEELNSDQIHYGRHLYNYKETINKRLWNYTIGNGSYLGEWGHIFDFEGCENISIKDVTLQGAFGDALLITDLFTSDDVVDLNSDNNSFLEVPIESENIIIDNVKCRYARRNGFAISCVNGIITNCIFEGCGIDNISGTDPKAGIDFECDRLNSNITNITYPFIGNKNVVMDNCIFINNYYDINISTPCPKITNEINPNWDEQTESEKYLPYTDTGIIIRNCKTDKLCLNRINNIQFENCDINVIKSVDNNLTAWWLSNNVIFNNCRLRRLSDYIIQNREGLGYTYNNCIFDNSGVKTYINNISVAALQNTNFTLEVTSNLRIDLCRHSLKLRGWLCSIVDNHAYFGEIEGDLKYISDLYSTITFRPSAKNRNDTEYYRMKVYAVRDKKTNNIKWILYPEIYNKTENTTYYRLFLTVECLKSGHIQTPSVGEFSDDPSYTVFFNYSHKFPLQLIKEKILPTIDTSQNNSYNIINNEINSVYDTYITPYTDDLGRNIQNVDPDTLDIIYKNINIDSYSIARENVNIPPEAGNIFLTGYRDIYHLDTVSSDYIHSDLYATGNGTKYRIPLVNTFSSIYLLNEIENGNWKFDNRYAFLSYYGPIAIQGNKVFNSDGSLLKNVKLVHNLLGFLTTCEYAGDLVVCGVVDLEGKTLNVKAKRIIFRAGGSLINGTINFYNTEIIGNSCLNINIKGNIYNNEVFVDWLIIKNSANILMLFDLKPSIVNFGGSTYSFSDIQIKDDVLIKGNKTIIQPVEILLNLFNDFTFLRNVFNAINVNNIEITGIIFKSHIHEEHNYTIANTDTGKLLLEGLYRYSRIRNAVGDVGSILNFELCKNITIKDCRFTNIENNPILPGTLYAKDIHGLLITCWDVYNTRFEHCEFDNILSHEFMYIFCKNLDRKLTNASFINNYWHDLNPKNGSCIGFGGGTVIVKDNLVDNCQYPYLGYDGDLIVTKYGSWANIYGLDVYCSNNIFTNCIYGSIFDTNEFGQWYNDNVVIESNTVDAKNAYMVISNAKNLVVKNNNVKAATLVLLYMSVASLNTSHKDMFIRQDPDQIPGKNIVISDNIFKINFTENEYTTVSYMLCPIILYSARFNIENVEILNNIIDGRGNTEYYGYDSASTSQKLMFAPINIYGVKRAKIVGNEINGYFLDYSRKCGISLVINVSNLNPDSYNFADSIICNNNYFKLADRPFIIRNVGTKYGYIKYAEFKNNQYFNPLTQTNEISGNPYHTCGWFDYVDVANVHFISHMTFIKINGLNFSKTNFSANMHGLIERERYNQSIVTFPEPTAIYGYNFDNTKLGDKYEYGQLLLVSGRIYKVLTTREIKLPELYLNYTLQGINLESLTENEDGVIDTNIICTIQTSGGEVLDINVGNILLKFISITRSKLFDAVSRGESNGLSGSDAGYMRYVYSDERKYTNLGIWNGGNWVDVNNYPLTAPHRGTKEERPTELSWGHRGFEYNDDTLSKMIFWDGSAWEDARGFSAARTRGNTLLRPIGIHTETITVDGEQLEILVGELSPLKDTGFQYYDTTIKKYIYAKSINDVTGEVKWAEIGSNLTKNNTNGMGIEYISEDENVLYQRMFPNLNFIYIISRDYTLGENITIPNNSILKFEGGSISKNNNYNRITLNNTYIEASKYNIFKDVLLFGTCKNEALLVDWFGNNIGVSDCSLFINNAIISAHNCNTCKVLLGGTDYHIKNPIIINLRVDLIGTDLRVAYLSGGVINGSRIIVDSDVDGIQVSSEAGRMHNRSIKNLTIESSVSNIHCGIVYKYVDITENNAQVLRLQVNANTIDNVTCKYFGYGVKFEGAGYYGIFGCQFNRLDCSYNKVGLGIITILGTDNRSTWFNHNEFNFCKFNYNKLGGIQIIGPDSIENNFFNNCTIELNGNNYDILDLSLDHIGYGILIKPRLKYGVVYLKGCYIEGNYPRRTSSSLNSIQNTEYLYEGVIYPKEIVNKSAAVVTYDGVDISLCKFNRNVIVVWARNARLKMYNNDYTSGIFKDYNELENIPRYLVDFLMDTNYPLLSAYMYQFSYLSIDETWYDGDSSASLRFKDHLIDFVKFYNTPAQAAFYANSNIHINTPLNDREVNISRNRGEYDLYLGGENRTSNTILGFNKLNTIYDTKYLDIVQKYVTLDSLRCWVYSNNYFVQESEDSRITKPITFKGVDENSALSAASYYKVFYNDVTFEDLTINNNTNDNTKYFIEMAVDNKNVIFKNCKINNASNYRPLVGGALANISFIDCIFTYGSLKTEDPNTYFATRNANSEVKFINCHSENAAGEEMQQMSLVSTIRSGLTSERPTQLRNLLDFRGYKYYDNVLKKLIYWSGERWEESDGAIAGVRRAGTFALKPKSSDIYVGFKYFCTDKKTGEGNTNGIEIIYKGQNTTDPANPIDIWVDALGRVIN